MIFALSLEEIGLNKLSILLIITLTIFFLISFVLTSKNMDIEGLLETLYGKDWPGKKFIAYPGKVTVIIGEKIDTTNLTSTQAHEKSVNWILDNLKKLEAKHIKES